MRASYPSPRVADAWRFSAGRWQAQPPDGADGVSVLTRLRVASFNVWFGEYEFERRANALCRILDETGAEVIGLQEVTQPFLDFLVARDWVREHYWLSDAAGDSFSNYGLILLSRVRPLRFLDLDLPTAMGRKLLAVDLGGMTIATVHLESLEHSRPVRLKQMEMIFSALRLEENAVLMGDMNFDTASPENERIEAGYRDLWPALNADKPGWTMDNAANTMRGALRKNPVPARFDRILLRGDWQPRSIRLLGTDPLAPDIYPSDHFGLISELHPPGR